MLEGVSGLEEALPSDPGRGAAGQVAVWVTTSDQRELLHRRPDVRFSPAPAGDALILDVDDRERFQPIDGFGASFTESAAVLIHDRLTPEARDETMRRLFDSQAGIGLSFLRQPMVSSDFALSDYTYDDVAPGHFDADLAHFSVAATREPSYPFSARPAP